MAGDEDWVGMLEREDVDGFNNRRTERSRPEMFAADLAGKKLTGVDLSNASLEKSDLTEADLTDANLLKANLAGIDGSGMKLTEALGLRSRFKEAWMDGADLTGADLAQSDFADANLERSTGRGVRFAQARLRGVAATGASWPEADLSEAKLHQAVLVGADLRGADLTEASAAEADLSGAVLDGAVGPGVKLPAAKLVGARLAGARFSGANLSGADLQRADLAAADLTRANLSGADLRGAILRGAVLADANLEGAKLDGADLSGADLTGLDPSALGLDGATVAGLAGFGVEYDASAPIVITRPSVAASGERIAVVWDNPEGEAPPPPADEDDEEGEAGPKTSVRFAVWRPRGGWVTGAIPVPGDQVLDRQVVAVPGGFRVVVTRARPEGAVVVLYDLSADGALGGARTVSLGYDPVVRPVLRQEGERLLQWGLARRGPTLVLHELSGPEPRPIRSDTLATAVGFLGSHPVLACKGGVVVPAGPTGPAAPRRTPEGFPGSRALALSLGDDVLAVWATPRVGETPGGTRFAVIGRRHAPREEVLGLKSGVLALAARTIDEERAEVFWAEAGEHGRGPTTLWRAVVPSDEPPTPIGGPEDTRELVAGPGFLAAVIDGGRLVVLDPEDGTVWAELGDDAG